MESPGGSWIPLFQILAARGFEVHRVKARQAKHGPGRQTDIADGQWRQTLHPCGLLKRSGRPTDDIGGRRSSVRRRDPLISAAATCSQPMHKALTDMNVQLANVIRDLSGVTGLAISRAL